MQIFWGSKYHVTGLLTAVLIYCVQDLLKSIQNLSKNKGLSPLSYFSLGGRGVSPPSQFLRLCFLKAILIFLITDLANFDRGQFTDLLADPSLNIEAADKVSQEQCSKLLLMS